MSEEMKLLMAMCDALGFAVEVNRDYKEQKESKSNAMRHNTGAFEKGTDRNLVCEPESGGPFCQGILLIDDDGLYTSRLIDPILSYKLTKISLD